MTVPEKVTRLESSGGDQAPRRSTRHHRIRGEKEIQVSSTQTLRMVKLEVSNTYCHFLLVALCLIKIRPFSYFEFSFSNFFSFVLLSTPVFVVFFSISSLHLSFCNPVFVVFFVYHHSTSVSLLPSSSYFFVYHHSTSVSLLPSTSYFFV